MMFETALSNIGGLVSLGGPVVALLLGMSLVALAVIIFKAAQFLRAGVGRHSRLIRAGAALDIGNRTQARQLAGESRSHLAPVFEALVDRMGDMRGDAGFRARVEVEASERLDHLEKGFRLLDSIAQIAPLLGLFGTVLGMIDAFQALQSAGDAVDPSILAGGIWVALMTTAAGLAVAMPTSLILTWFETRMQAERALAGSMITRAFCPVAGPEAPECAPLPVLDAHAR
ncbi:MotA/TolQ/ExbB proton channel family protein [Gymnodinialimonas sp.]